MIDWCDNVFLHDNNISGNNFVTDINFATRNDKFILLRTESINESLSNKKRGKTTPVYQ